jgi:hypothetical protein
MACFSGFPASRAVAERRPADVISRCVNEGIGEGFMVGTPMAIFTLIIEAWT